MTVPAQPRLGLRANLPQFSLLVLVNAFVGAMVGMERSILPLIAGQEFGLASHSAILSFLVSFGIVKALSNLFAGRFSDRFGRKRLLTLGWLFGIPVPVLLMIAPSWSWVVVANVLLGVQQGLCWSTTVIMKIDLVGPRRRGLATGLNEFAGYLAVAVAAYASAVIAEHFGLRPFPFFLGVGCSVLGLLLTLLFVKDTRNLVHLEALGSSSPAADAPSPAPASLTFRKIFLLSSWENNNLFSCAQAGLVNNLNDGMAWGLFPLLYSSLKFSLGQIGALTALYPAVWGMCQLFTGAISDHVGRKWMIALGMWFQALALFVIGTSDHLEWHAVAAAMLGIGTAMVYPTLLAAVGDNAHPLWRASAIGVYRLWRDLGYAAGALISGAVADLFGVGNAILTVGLLTLLSGAVAASTFSDAHPRF